MKTIKLSPKSKKTIISLERQINDAKDKLNAAREQLLSAQANYNSFLAQRQMFMKAILTQQEDVGDNEVYQFDEEYDLVQQVDSPPVTEHSKNEKAPESS